MNTNEIVRFRNEDQIQSTAQVMLAEVRNLTVDSQPKYLQVKQYSVWAKMGVQFVKDFFEPIRKPQREALEATLGKIRTYSKPFEQAEILAKQRMRGWEEIQARKAAEQTAKQAAKAEEKGITPPPPVANKAKVDGVTYQEHYVVKIVDRDAVIKAVLSGKLPPNVVTINMGELNNLANSTKGQLPLAGCEIVRQDIVKVRI